jgi:hypothetical protein
MGCIRICFHVNSLLLRSIVSSILSITIKVPTLYLQCITHGETSVAGAWITGGELLVCFLNYALLNHLLIRVIQITQWLTLHSLRQSIHKH